MAHLSLEFVVSFIILLVVAGIIISIMFTNVNPSLLSKEEIKINQMKFKGECERLCNDMNSLEYCRHYFDSKQVGSDWNGNGMYELITIGDEITWKVCEDRIYCFLVVPCPRFGENPIKGCVNALCSAYLKKYDGNITKANEAVLDKIKKGSCTLPTEREDNWFERYFSVDPCGCECSPWIPQGIGLQGNSITCTFKEIYYNRTCLPGGCTKEPSEKCEHVSLNLKNCKYLASTNNITCETNCENRTGYWTNITVTNSTGAIANAATQGTTPVVGSITFQITPSPLDENNITFSTSPSLSTLNPGDRANWNVTLYCSKPEGIITIKGVS